MKASAAYPRAYGRKVAKEHLKYTVTHAVHYTVYKIYTAGCACHYC